MRYSAGALALYWCCNPALAADDCAIGTRAADAATELAQFEFLLGDWTIELRRWTDNGWSPPRPQPARWHGRYALGGYAIYDEWFDVDPTLAPDTKRGANLRVYDRDAKRWSMTWLHTAGNVGTVLAAEIRAGVLTMWQTHPVDDSWEAEFVVENATEWVRTRYQKDASGQRTPQFQLTARRAPCGDETTANR